MNLAAHDRALKKFRYGEALDSALAGGRTEVVAAVIGELVHRGGLRTALAGRDASALLPVLAFVARHIAEPRHAQQMCGVLDRVLDIYGGSVGASPEVDAKLRQMKERLVVAQASGGALQAPRPRGAPARRGSRRRREVTRRPGQAAE